MTDAPERIKAWVTRNGVTEWEAGSLQFPPDTEVEYVRADLFHRAAQEALEAAAYRNELNVRSIKEALDMRDYDAAREIAMKCPPAIRALEPAEILARVNGGDA